MTPSEITALFQAAAALVTVGGVGLVLKSSLFTVKQQTAAIIERLGKFQKTATAGLNWKVPFIDKIVQVVDLRPIQADFNPQICTKDNVFVTIPFSPHYIIKDPQKFVYGLTNPEKQLESFALNVLRPAVTKMNLADLASSQDEIQKTIDDNLKHKMEPYGIEVLELVMGQPAPSDEVKAVFDEVMASQRRKEATLNDASAEAKGIIKKAAADAQALRLRGRGIAWEREEVFKGMDKIVAELDKNGIRPEMAVALMLATNAQDATVKAAGKGSIVITTPDAGTALQSLYGLTAQLHTPQRNDPQSPASKGKSPEVP